ncbi:MAG TPA: lactonase family protein [Bryobacteraceae bacterium]|nr:lactonase family protein [Bryobacteraceae bacterium]
MMKRYRAVSLLAATAWIAGAVLPAAAADLTVYFGTHTAGPGKGFSAARFNTETGALSKPEFLLETPAPAYFVIAPGGRRLYSCNSTGFVSAYAIDPATARLSLINQKPSGGGDPSYISLDTTGHYVFVANYDGGNIAAWALGPDGSLGERTAFVQHTGSSVNPQRQKHAFAHSIRVDPTNRFVLVADLGLDKLFVYKFNVADGSLTPNDPPFARSAPGAGARHVVFHPNGRWVYLITEMGSTIMLFDWDTRRGALSEVQTVSTLPQDFHGENMCSEIVVHPNGRFVYASNRGRDSIAVFSVDAGTGRLTSIQDMPSGGKTPRNFDLDPTAHWLLVTNHGSDNAMVFRIDQQTGRLTPVGQPVEVPYPFCPRFLAR